MFQCSHLMHLQDLVLALKISLITVKLLRFEVLSTPNMWVLVWNLAERCVMSKSKIVGWHGSPPLWEAIDQRNGFLATVRGYCAGALWFTVMRSLLALLPVILLLPVTCSYSPWLALTTFYALLTLSSKQPYEVGSYLCFTDQGTKAQRRIVTFLWPHGQWVVQSSQEIWLHIQCSLPLPFTL